jgi:ATP-dependent protease HslVU (ClpYQ) peptidase subunit
MSNSQKLIIEFEGPEEEIQKLLEHLEELVEKSWKQVEIKAVTLRKD